MKATQTTNKGNKDLWLKRVLTATCAWGTVLRAVILLAIPYAYLMLCGLIFDKWLRLYDMIPFIFYSLVVLYLAAFVLVAFTIIWSVRAIKSGVKKPVKTAKKYDAPKAKKEKPAKPAKEAKPAVKEEAVQPKTEESAKEEPAAEPEVMPEELPVAEAESEAPAKTQAELEFEAMFKHEEEKTETADDFWSK